MRHFAAARSAAKASLSKDRLPIPGHLAGKHHRTGLRRVAVHWGHRCGAGHVRRVCRALARVDSLHLDEGAAGVTAGGFHEDTDLALVPGIQRLSFCSRDRRRS